MFKWYYAVWLAFPLFFLLLALWSKLEQMSGRPRKDYPPDVINQGFFVLVCVLVCIGIDAYLLDDLYSNFLPDWVPIGLLQFLLLPAVLLVAARLMGPSKEIRITKAPAPSKSRPQDKPKK